MYYSRFEDLPVWQSSITLATQIFKLCGDKSFFSQGDLGRQLGKAALSVSNNIAEGFERRTTKELLAFLYIARGSAGEVRSMLYVIGSDERYIHLEPKRAELFDLVISISRQLKGWIDSLDGKSR